MALLTYKSYHGTFTALNNTVNDTHKTAIMPDYLQLPDWYNLADLLFYFTVAVVSSELMYHLICGFLQVYYYRMQRDQPEKWKCQPHRFLTRSNETHEFIVGTINLFIAGGML